MARAMGLDVGTKTIGVAFSDPLYLIAQAHKTIQRTNLNEDIEKLEKLMEANDVNEIVLGLPKHMNNDEGRSAQRSRSFGQEIEKRLGRPVIYQDERMTSISANQVLMDTGVRREKRKDHIDALAASFILQTWLDKRR